MIGVSYQEFVNLVETKELLPQLVDAGDRWDLYAFDGPFHFSCSVKKDSEDADNLESTIAPLSNKRLEPIKDADGAQVINPKFAGSGRSYNSLHFELEVGVPGTLKCKTVTGEDLPYLTMHCYDEEMEPTTDPTEVVRTTVLMSPPFSYDIQGFCLYQRTLPASDLYVWAVVAPFVPKEMGGAKESITNMNLRLSPYDKTFMDYVGDSATTIDYVEEMPYANQLELIFSHQKGISHKVMAELIWYI